MLERLRTLSEAMGACQSRQECARASPVPAFAPEQELREARLPPDEVMRRLRELAAPAQRVASADASAFGALPRHVSAANPSGSINPESLRAIEEGRHEHIK